MRYMRIFAGVPQRGASNANGVVEDGNSDLLIGYLLENFRQDIYTEYTAP